MVAKLIGGKNDGAVINIPYDDAPNRFGIPFSLAIQYKQGKLLYEFQEADFNNGVAIYEYSGVIYEEE
jgi:hypothetical protein